MSGIISDNLGRSSGLVKAVAAAGGAWTFLKKIDAGTSASVSFIHGTADVVFDNTYQAYKIFTRSWGGDSATESPMLMQYYQTGSDGTGTPTLHTSANYYYGVSWHGNAAFASYGGHATSSFALSGDAHGVTNSGTFWESAEITIASQDTHRSTSYWIGAHLFGSGYGGSYAGGGSLENNYQIGGVKLFPENGSFRTACPNLFYLYGLAKS